MVRRTRSFIKDNYALTDDTNGRKYLLFPDNTRSYFPDRQPKKVEFEFDVIGHNDQYAKLYSEEVVNTINSLNLPRYGLGKYIDKKKEAEAGNKEKQIISNLFRAGKRLMGFCRTNLFKRLESSGYSFLLSVTRHILRNYLFVYALENNLPIPIGQQESNLLDEFLDDNDLDNNLDPENELKNIEIFKLVTDKEVFLKNAATLYNVCSYNNKSNFDWIDSEHFLPKLKEELICRTLSY